MQYKERLKVINTFGRKILMLFSMSNYTINMLAFLKKTCSQRNEMFVFITLMQNLKFTRPLRTISFILERNCFFFFLIFSKTFEISL